MERLWRADRIGKPSASDPNMYKQSQAPQPTFPGPLHKLVDLPRNTRITHCLDMPSQLILDVLHDVFQHLDDVNDTLKPDYGALRACAQTCREWLHPARVQLYKRVSLRGLTSLACFYRTLMDVPEVRPLVQTLTIREGYYHPGRIPVWSGRHLRTSEWSFGAELIPTLSGLVSLSIMLDGFLWDEKAQRFYRSFLKAWMGHPHLRKLELHNFNFPTLRFIARTLTSFPQLEAISLIHVVAVHGKSKQVDPAVENVISTRRKLTTVELFLLSADESPSCYLPLFGTAVQHLSITWEWVPFMENIKEQGTNNVVSNLLDLRTITLAVVHQESMRDWLPVVLSEIRSERLEEVVLLFFALDYDGFDLISPYFPPESRLDDLLCEPPFDKLRAVTLWTYGFLKPRVVAKRLEKMKAHFPRCRARGILRDNTTPPPGYIPRY